MSIEESLEVRQKNEFEALQAIYGDDLKDLRGKAVWNKWRPLNLSISLTPQQGSSGTQEIYVKIDLHIICSEKYPDRVPRISLEHGRGLSNVVLGELQEKLEAKANELKGEEMIFQLCQFVQEFLHRHNKPASMSFYDQMLQTKKEKELKEMQAKKSELDKQRQHMREEIQSRQDILKSEVRLRRENRQNSENDGDFETTRRRRTDSSADSSSESLCQQHKGPLVIEFDRNEIQRGPCIDHFTPNHVEFAGIDKKSGKMVIISEWYIEIKCKNDLSLIYRQLNSIEQEMDYLTKLKHCNLSRYYKIKHQVDEGCVTVYLLKEFIKGCTCSALFFSQNIKANVEFIKHIAKGVLTGLEFLHRNNVIHKDIKDTDVYINDAGVIKLANYSINRKLADLVSRTYGTYTKKTDIFNFGKLLLSLVQGGNVSDDNLEIPHSIQPDLYDFLTRCLVKNESECYTATQLLNHSFLHRETVHSPLKHQTQEVALDRNVSPEVFHDLLALSQSSNGQSRIKNEFEFLQHLGTGAFGDVIKVRNKLDGCYYAIKRIRLNPKKRSLNRKIIREVKLLSRLNHENVVRYYNSWIETTTIKEEIDDGTSINSGEEKAALIRKDELTINDDIERLAPPLKNVEVSITYDSKSQAPFKSSSDEDSSDDEDGVLNNLYAESDSDGIEFLHDSETSQKSASTSTTADNDSKKPHRDIVSQIDFMYIQMEFCEKSTLRIAIDNSLYLDENRVWRLFREIVEGLAHIHQQGMIHRDLKPVNIFLDSEDHVKIGDFGLATTVLKARQNEYAVSRSLIESEKEETDESKTGQVGTALYVAPEINTQSRVVYNQKVDIYSLGIILFEMFNKPSQTSMERITTISKLRQKEIIFPEEFAHGYLTMMLANALHPRNYSSLSMFHRQHTLSNPQLKGYKYLIASCFNQSVTPAQDITYDKDPLTSGAMKPLQLYDFVREVCVKIFEQHGGQNLSTPLLMPKCKFYEGSDSCVNLMTHCGSIVSLPHDLRVPFARYVAWNNITFLRRYSIERVYREKKVFGFHPRELYECAFDIVSPTQGNLLSDAEVLYIVYEIINELPGVKNKRFRIKLNHTLLLQAILLHCGVKDKHQEVLDLISDVKDRKVQKYELYNFFITLGLSDTSINLLLNLFYIECEISKASSQFQMLTKKRSGEASRLAITAIEELKIIGQYARTYGVKFDIVISPGLVYNAHQYSGMICQFVCDLTKKHKHESMEVLAAGGRYDSMITWYRSKLEQANMLGKGIQQSAVGVSISLDRLVQALQKEQVDLLKVAVCSVDTKNTVVETTKVLRSLWAAGIKTVSVEGGSVNEIQEGLNELKASHSIFINDQGIARLRNLDKDTRFQEKLYTTSELVENLPRILKASMEGSQENAISPTILSKSDSRTSYGDRGDHYQETNVSILFVDKMASNIKRRHENQIRSVLDGVFKKLTGHVIALGINLEANVITTLAFYLKFETEQRFQESARNVMEKHQKHKKYLLDVCDEIYEQKTKRTNPTIILFSLLETFYEPIF
ncbi:hypothetical protein NQ315_009367 [Exocentrus adspersus]|uniref:non-specific serine/threonine protein kinase n=1 Tax=Exocentrus adspersus TaxID=1586481 RepID=A0AAV8WGG9_9CUCU|nr:hypothetical protein NQ315_009367 [Exocentrus adspersus]